MTPDGYLESELIRMTSRERQTGARAQLRRVFRNIHCATLP